MNERFLAVNENGEFRFFNLEPKRAVDFNTQKGIWYVDADLDCDFGVLVDKNSLPQDLKTLKWEDSQVIFARNLKINLKN